MENFIKQNCDGNRCSFADSKISEMQREIIFNQILGNKDSIKNLTNIVNEKFKDLFELSNNADKDKNDQNRDHSCNNSLSIFQYITLSLVCVASIAIIIKTVYDFFIKGKPSSTIYHKDVSSDYRIINNNPV